MASEALARRARCCGPSSARRCASSDGARLVGARPVRRRCDVRPVLPEHPGQRRDAQGVHGQHAGVPRKAFLGASGDFASPAGYLNTELFNFFAPLLLLLFAIGAGARAIAGEEERQTLDILLSMPVPRRRVVIDKFAAMLAAGVLLSVLMWLSVAAIGPPFDLQAEPRGTSRRPSSMCFLLAMAFGAIALAVGCRDGAASARDRRDRGHRAGTFIVNMLVPAIESIEWLQLALAVLLLPGRRADDARAGRARSLVLVGIAAVAFGVALVGVRAPGPRRVARYGRRTARSRARTIGHGFARLPRLPERQHQVVARTAGR